MTTTTDAFTVMTYNIRYATSDDELNAWENRRDLAIAAIVDHDPDLLGVQEATARQREDLATALRDWIPFGGGSSEPATSDTDLPMGFVRGTRFELLDGGRFWLSDTPAVEGSMTWPNDGGARLCCWRRLRDRRANRALVFASTHFDTNASAWTASAEVLHAELDRIAGTTPSVVVGDFNCAAGSAAHDYLRTRAGFRDAWYEAGHADVDVITFNGFLPYLSLPKGDALERWLDRTASPSETFGHYRPHIRTHQNSRIDWILLRGSLRVVSAANDYRHDGARLPSDHYPVVARVEWMGSNV